jgi:hypothetical protein
VAERPRAVGLGPPQQLFKLLPEPPMIIGELAQT